jgi:hypothetical protein
MVFRVVRAKLAVFCLSLNGIALLMVVFIICIGELWYSIQDILLSLALFVTMLGFFIHFVHLCLIKRIIITESGLEYRTLFKRVHKSWDEIKHIDVFRKGVPPRRESHNGFWIYFYDVWTDWAYAKTKSFLQVQYRKEVISEIKKYYDKEILGLIGAELRDTTMK